MAAGRLRRSRRLFRSHFDAVPTDSLVPRRHDALEFTDGVAEELVTIFVIVDVLADFADEQDGFGTPRGWRSGFKDHVVRPERRRRVAAGDEQASRCPSLGATCRVEETAEPCASPPLEIEAADCALTDAIDPARLIGRGQLPTQRRALRH